MTSCSTHVLDATLGRPATALRVVLTAADAVLEAVTDADGRIRFVADLPAGTHRLTFATGPWFAAADRDTYFPSIDVTFEVKSEEEHHHVALLLGPYSYTTYRGS